MGSFRRSYSFSSHRYRRRWIIWLRVSRRNLAVASPTTLAPIGVLNNLKYSSTLLLLCAFIHSFNSSFTLQVDAIFQMLLWLEGTSGAPLLLQILENLFCGKVLAIARIVFLMSFFAALEEQNLPSPRGFSAKFAELGLRCLPRKFVILHSSSSLPPPHSFKQKVFSCNTSIEASSRSTSISQSK